MSSKIFIQWTILFILTGCGSQTSLTPTATIFKSPIPHVPTVMSIPSPILTPFVLTEVTPTPSCPILINGDVSLQDLGTGTIVVDGPVIEPLSLLELQKGVEFRLPLQNSKSLLFLGGEVSSNRNLFAYLTGKQSQTGRITDLELSITDSRAGPLKRMTLLKSAVSNMRWLDNERLLFYSDQTMDNGTVIVVNPFDNQQYSISHELPNFYADASWRLDWQIEYSPDLNQVVYFGDIPGVGLGPIVYDLENEKIVWQPLYPGNNFKRPIWSPDGQEVAVVAGGQLYIVKRNGDVWPVLKGQLSDVAKPSWSPDGRYIAFWNFHKLMLYDDKSKQVTNYCVEEQSPTPTMPLWNPNSQQFIIDQALNQGGKLIDIPQKSIYKLENLPDTVYPVEWMNSIP